MVWFWSSDSSVIAPETTASFGTLIVSKTPCEMSGFNAVFAAMSCFATITAVWVSPTALFFTPFV